MAAIQWLRCPKTGAELVFDGDRLVSRDANTRLAYPVKDDVPELLPDCGVELSPDEWSAVMPKPL